VALLVIRAFELWGKPCWLAIWYNAQIARVLLDDLWLLSFNCADAEAGVFLKDFLSVEVVECLGGILAGYLSED